VGVVVYDARCGAGGLAHVQLPNSGGRQEFNSSGPWSFADKAVPELFHRCYALGARKQGMKVVLAGGASILDPTHFFDIGRKNSLMCKKLLWQNGVFLTAQRIGGQEWRTVSLELGTGRIVIKSQKSQEEF
jgi:chemotaxis protein CheD